MLRSADAVHPTRRWLFLRRKSHQFKLRQCRIAGIDDRDGPGVQKGL
jgi:hypothetical protein